MDQTYWVAPLPPEGPVTVVLAWPGVGLPESRTILDGGAPQPPPAAPRPSTGWFAQPPG